MKRLLLLSSLIVLTGAGCAGTASTPAARPVHGVPTQAGTTPEPVKEDNVLVVAASQTAGKDILLETVAFGRPGFVVITDDDNGKPGKTLGASALIASGEHQNVTVPIKVEAGKTYWSILHTDNGNGTYAEAEDQPTLDSNGIMLISRITAPAVR